MAFAWEKYRLELSEVELETMGRWRTERVIRAWAKESGVMNVKNHRIEIANDVQRATLTYTACIDSAGWTGISSP